MDILAITLAQITQEFPHIFEQNFELDPKDYLIQPNDIQFGGVLTHNIAETSRSYHKKFKCSTTKFNIQFNRNVRTFAQAADEIQQAFVDIHQEFTARMGERDKIRIIFDHDSFHFPIALPFMSKNTFNPVTMYQTFYKLNSNKEVSINENNNLTASVIIAHLPSGSGRKMINLVKKQKPYIKKKDRVIDENLSPIQEFCELKSSIKTVINNDNLCALRAILIGKAYVDNHPLKSKLAQPNNNLLNEMVQKVSKALALGDKPCGIQEIKRI